MMVPPNHSMGRWLAEARAGSREALGQALEACRCYLLLVAEGHLAEDLRGKGGASDLVQETFLEAQRDFAHFRGQTEEELLAWLRQLLLNNLANFTRSFRTTQKREVAREVSLDSDTSPLPPEGLPSSGPLPCDEAVLQEEGERLQQALTLLPDDYRRVLTLRYQQDLSFDEIAEVMGRSANAVRKLFARAIERLQEIWGAPP